MYLQIYSDLNTHLHIYISLYTYIYIHIYIFKKCNYIRTYVRTYIHTWTHTYLHTCKKIIRIEYVYMHLFACLDISTYIYIYTKHMYINIYFYVFIHEPPSKLIVYSWYKNIGYRFFLGGAIALQLFFQINTK